MSAPRPNWPPLLLVAGLSMTPSLAVSQPAPDQDVRATILPGAGPVPPPAPTAPALQPGAISLNYPQVDVGVAAQAILGGILHRKYAIDPSVHGVVSVVTAAPIRRSDVLAFFEDALKQANLALAPRGDTLLILPVEAARAQAGLVAPGALGFGTETLALKYASAEQLKALLDPIVPGVILSADPTRNLLVIAGTTGQREEIRNLVAQFDVDWLRGMSFALFVPEHTDARLIAPELDKLLNGPGAETAGLVRLIPMQSLNGILAVSAQPQLLEDARRFVEVLDREGEGAERRIFVYKAQNSRAADLAKVLDAAFGIATAKSEGEGAPDLFGAAPPPAMAAAPQPAIGAAPYVAAAPAPNPAIARALPGYSGPAAQAPAAPAEGAPEATGPGAQGVTITADDATNSLVVYATPRQYAIIEEALAKLDVLPLEVLIDAAITEVTLDHRNRFGIQWSAVNGRNSGAFSLFPSGQPQALFPGFSYLYTGNGITATVSALAKTNDVNVLSAPKLLVLNDHTAQIEVGDQVPVATGSAVSPISSGAPIVNSIDYRDTGVILKVTPRVNSSGLVLLDLTQEVSEVSGAGISGSPTIQQRKITTSVAVQDGATIALGGLIRDQGTRKRKALPLLGQAPVLGWLFGSTVKANQRTELIVLLTPRVIRTADQAQAVTEELRAKIGIEAPKPKHRRLFP